ncbi:fungal-specific transcription factor domain-containing protein [Lentinula lateritia]|uniref:Fungal-specific transcription factor domain-containing protein n=1 Tax=Lentinula lateritia TaxID=40482 RepID=A0ABQ8W073_9AGAR|nr:fungal-specific transcription factor domain-containing protein [Lentinula lateritia]
MSDSRTCSRPIQSCYQCRKRKIKCNRAYPCAPCILRGEGDVCREVDKNQTSSSKSTTETLDDVLHRVTVLERAVSHLSKLLPPDLNASGVDDSDSSISTAMSSSSMPKSRPQSSSRLVPVGSASDGDVNPESVIRSSYGTGSTDEDVAMMLEDFAMGHRVNRSRAAQELDPGPSDLYTHRQMTAYGSQSAPPRHESHENVTRSLPLTPVSATDVFVPQLGLPDHHPLALLIDINTNVIGRLVSVLPAKSHCLTLVTFYFERLEWYSKVLHSPSFLSDAHQLMGQVFPTSSNGPLCDYSVLVHVSVPFLSVYFMVLCLSLHLIEPDTCRILNIGFDEATELSKKMYNAAQACLYVSDFIGNHSLEALQCLILMGVYQQNLDEADSHWALLGSAIKMAQNLGISRLGSESDNKTYTGIWTSVIKREVARRIWWSLVFNDWSHAAAHNGAYSIHPSQNHTGFPANINDVDLVDGFPLKVRPIMEYTEMTLSLTRFRFVGIYREIVDNMQSPTGYDFVTEIDAKIRKMQEEVPRYFEEYNLNTPDNSASPPPYNPAQNVKQLELTLCLLMGETRQLRLHRPYLFKGYKDRKYAKSREQCINSARAILNLLKSNDEQSAILLKWWMVLFYGFAASVVLFIDLCHHKADNGLELEMRRVELREALDLFKTVEHISTVSRNAIALLEGLMSVEPDIPSKPSRKRGAYTQESEEPFGQVVKRMIIDAHQTASSPISQSNGSLVSSPTKPLSPASTPHATLHHRSRSESYTTSTLSVTPEVGIDEYPPRISIPVNRAMPSSSSRWSSTQISLPHTLSNGLSMAPSGHSNTNQRRKDGLTCVNPIGGELDNSSTPPFGLGWGLPARDALAPNILFRESEMFELLWSDESFGYGIRNAGTPGNAESARDDLSLAGFESFNGMAFTGT